MTIDLFRLGETSMKSSTRTIITAAIVVLALAFGVGFGVFIAAYAGLREPKINRVSAERCLRVGECRLEASENADGELEVIIKPRYGGAK